MTWSEIPWNPPTRTLRQFAGLWLLVFLVLACWQMTQHGWTVVTGCCVLAGLFGPVGLWRPRLFRSVFVGSLVLTFPIAWVVSRLSLVLMYFLIVTPLGWGLRRLGHDPLRLRQKGTELSYWEPLSPVPDVSRYLRQY